MSRSVNSIIKPPSAVYSRDGRPISNPTESPTGGIRSVGDRSNVKLIAPTYDVTVGSVLQHRHLRAIASRRVLSFLRISAIPPVGVEGPSRERNGASRAADTLEIPAIRRVISRPVARRGEGRRTREREGEKKTRVSNAPAVARFYDTYCAHVYARVYTPRNKDNHLEKRHCAASFISLLRDFFLFCAPLFFQRSDRRTRTARRANITYERIRICRLESFSPRFDPRAEDGGSESPRVLPGDGIRKPSKNPETFKSLGEICAGTPITDIVW